jgi:hypothetical protein
MTLLSVLDQGLNPFWRHQSLIATEADVQAYSL